MRLIDADELLEHAGRDKLDSRELIAKMIMDAPTIRDVSVKIPLGVAWEIQRLLAKAVSEEQTEISMTNQEKFIEIFGLEAWKNMVFETELADKFMMFWTSPYTKAESEVNNGN